MFETENFSTLVQIVIPSRVPAVFCAVMIVSQLVTSRRAQLGWRLLEVEEERLQLEAEWASLAEGLDALHTTGANLSQTAVAQQERQGDFVACPR